MDKEYLELLKTLQSQLETAGETLDLLVGGRRVPGQDEDHNLETARGKLYDMQEIVDDSILREKR